MKRANGAASSKIALSLFMQHCHGNVREVRRSWRNRRVRKNGPGSPWSQPIEQPTTQAKWLPLFVKFLPRAKTLHCGLAATSASASASTSAGTLLALQGILGNYNESTFGRVSACGGCRLVPSAAAAAAATLEALKFDKYAY